MIKKKFPFYHQLDAMDCGATCLRMLAKYYGKTLSIDKLRDKCFTNREGVSLLGISDAAESVGMRTLCARLSYDNLKTEAPFPFVAYWRERHFLIVNEIKKGKVYVSDPAHGQVVYTEEEFKQAWICSHGTEEPEGYALFIEPTPEFYAEEEFDVAASRAKGLKSYLGYLKPYKRFYFQLILSLGVATLLQIIFPFLTQAMVDVGVSNQDLGFVYLIVFAQIALFISTVSNQFIRRWLLLHMNARINISIRSDFLVKLMKLPISFFERKTPGDIMQRIQDHNRIQQFFTSQTVDFIFSCISIIVFGTILFSYDFTIFIVYIIGSILYFGWILLFMKKRKELDYRNFDQSILNRNKTIQLLTGMQEIKLQNCETQKRWEWERIQVRSFKLNVKSLVVEQFEQSGGAVLNGIKNILLTFYAATLVIEGDMTLGMMLATQFIVGQLNALTTSMIWFLHNAQNAMISADRLAEIHSMENEEDENRFSDTTDLEARDIEMKNVSFQYGGPRSAMVIKDFNLTIPRGKTTAIVGSSGSGKSTLLKLLLKSYDPTEGEITYGEANLKNISYKAWRQKFATVTQDSFIFSDTIARNIAVGEEQIDKKKLKFATQTANIREYIEGLPVEYNTKIGEDGVGISQGQKQRVLLARAIYKDADMLILDEATNALDANNEKKIVENLNAYCEGKTVVVVAHRLSTVKHADQIIVLDKGEISEQGTHDELVEQKGAYFDLVKNQLSLA